MDATCGLMCVHMPCTCVRACVCVRVHAYVKDLVSECVIHLAAFLCPRVQSPMVMQLKTIMKQKTRAAWVQENQKKKMTLSKEMFLPVTVSWDITGSSVQSYVLNVLFYPMTLCVCV